MGQVAFLLPGTEMAYSINMGRPQREFLIGEPNCYCVHAQCALGQELFAIPGEIEEFLTLLEAVRICFDFRIFAYLIEADSYTLLLQHHPHSVDEDHTVHLRWQNYTGSHKTVAIQGLRDRFGSLSGIMQTIGQDFSRGFHRRQGGRGSIWAGRYRSCLLADDAGLLAAIAWINSKQESALSLGPLHNSDHPITLSPSPLREVAAGVVTPTDEAPLGTVPASAKKWPVLLKAFIETLSKESCQAYGHALGHSWVLGRAESLVPSLSRMSRPSGRGRSRQLHDLNDDLGLCGIWG